MSRFQTVGDIINRVAVSIGLDPVNDPYTVDDPAFVQLRVLVNECGEDLVLVEGQQWQQLERTHEFMTAPGDTGSYDLPADFGYMIDQTHWQKASPGPAAYPLLGPGSPQWWSYLQGTQLYNVTLFAWFRQVVGKFELWPQPPPVGIPVSYKYISRHWVRDTTTTPNTHKDFVERAADVVLFEPILFLKKLKLAFLQAKGFDTTKAQDEYDVALNTVGGRDKPAAVLSLTGPVHAAPPLLSHLNVPETGIGS